MSRFRNVPKSEEIQLSQDLEGNHPHIHQSVRRSQTPGYGFCLFFPCKYTRKYTPLSSPHSNSVGPSRLWYSPFTLLLQHEDFCLNSREFRCSIFHLLHSLLQKPRPLGCWVCVHHLPGRSPLLPYTFFLSFIFIYLALCSDPHIEYFHSGYCIYLRISYPVRWLSRQRHKQLCTGLSPSSKLTKRQERTNSEPSPSLCVHTCTCLHIKLINK